MRPGLRALLSVALLAIIIAILPWAELRDAARRVRGDVWLLVLAGFLAGHVLGAAKWMLLVRASGAHLRWSDACRCYAAGLFANICMPTVVGGDVVRVAMVSRITGRTEAALLGGIADRAIDFATTGALIGVAGFLVGDAFPSRWPALTAVLVCLAVLAAVASLPLVARRPLARWRPSVRRRVGRMLVALRRLVALRGMAAWAVLLSLLIQGAFVLLNAWLGHTLGASVPIAVWFLVWPLAKLAGLLPISLGGLAVRDATLAALLMPAGVPLALGVVVGLVWQSVLIAGGLIAGAFWWFTSASRDENVFAMARRSTRMATGHE